MLFTVGGQCEGYGGIFEALRTLIPVDHAWYAETDVDASAVLAHHYPDAPNLGDITTVDWLSIERPDILTSGFPCQPTSHAGHRLGGSDPRYLWPTGVLPAIAALRPRLAILENVRGLLTIDDGALFGGILADLDDLRYTVSWATVGACLVGAGHHRHRVFLTATLADVRAPVVGQVAQRGPGGWEAAQGVLFGTPDAAPKWPSSGLLAGGQVWETPGSACVGRRGVWLPTPRGSDARKGSPNQHGRTGDLMLPSAVQPERFAAYAEAVARHEAAYGLRAPPPTVLSRGRIRLSAAFSEFLQGLPPGWLTDVADNNAAARLAGNGVNPRQCAYALTSSPVFQCWARQTALGIVGVGGGGSDART